MNNRRKIEIRRNRRKKENRLRREEMIDFVKAEACRDIEEFFAKQFPVVPPGTLEIVLTGVIEHPPVVARAVKEMEDQILQELGVGVANPIPTINLSVPIAPKDYLQLLGHCKACGNGVAAYLCNEQLQEARPEGAAWDYWASCLTPTCSHHHGEGYLQALPDWIEEKR